MEAENLLKEYKEKISKGRSLDDKDICMLMHSYHEFRLEKYNYPQNYKILKLDKEESKGTICVSEIPINSDIIEIKNRSNKIIYIGYHNKDIIEYKEDQSNFYAIINGCPVKIKPSNQNTITIEEITPNMDIMVLKNGKRIDHIFYKKSVWFYEEYQDESLINVISHIEGYYTANLEFRVIEVK